MYKRGTRVVKNICIFYFRVTTPLSRKPLLTNAPYPFYDWFAPSNKEKDLYVSSNLREGR